jgi:iron only hydrogenase large subunit-like protein
MRKIDFDSLPDEDFDDPLGISTGAAALFGATGGVMEAALRTAYEKATGKELTKIEFDQVRGEQRIKTGSIMINGIEVKFAAVHTIRKAQELLKDFKGYHFIEVMACPGGCIGGGGQPIPTTWAIRRKRMQGIYSEDGHLPLRKSHENPVLKKMYDEYMGDVGGHRAHELLHTTYEERDL